MRAACIALDYPVVSGNVSLYNETEGTAILPTPVIGGAAGRHRQTWHCRFQGVTRSDRYRRDHGLARPIIYLREIEGRERTPTAG